MINLKKMLTIIKSAQDAKPGASPEVSSDKPAAPPIEETETKTFTPEDFPIATKKEKPQQTFVPQQSLEVVNAIKKMQQSLINFSSDFNTGRDFPGQIKKTDEDKKNINNIIATHFSDNSRSVSKTGESDLLKDIFNMQSIGRGNSPDGIWGNKTQQAIKDIIDFSKYLQSTTQTFGMQNTFYKIENGDSLLKQIEPIPSGKEKEKIALEISEYVDNVKKLYDQFIYQMKSSDNMKYIKGEALSSYSNGQDADQLTDAEKDVIRSNEKISGLDINIAEKQQTEMPLNIFSSKENFENYIRGLNPNSQNFKEILNEIKRQFDSINPEKF